MSGYHVYQPFFVSCFFFLFSILNDSLVILPFYLPTFFLIDSLRSLLLCWIHVVMAATIISQPLLFSFEKTTNAMMAAFYRTIYSGSKSILIHVIIRFFSFRRYSLYFLFSNLKSVKSF